MLCVLAGGVRARAALPAYVEKPPTWTSKLIGAANQTIKDSELAGWIKDEQDVRQFTVICTFTTCFSGGFVTEIKKHTTRYGANSASRYFETSAYDPANNRSYYAHAWQNAADYTPPAAAPNDQTITDNAYNAQPAGVKATALAQYQSDPAGPPAPPTDKLATLPQANKFAILFVASPEAAGWDATDVSELYGRLLDDDTYNFDPGNIEILYGIGAADGSIPGGAAWKASAVAATKANLHATFTGWLRPKLAVLNPEDEALLFLWTGDHGGVDFPVSFSVDPRSTGLLATAVNDRATAAPANQYSAVYEGGSEKNLIRWAPAPIGDIDALSDGLDAIVPRPPGQEDAVYLGTPLFFSVDRASVGAAESGVRREWGRGRAVGPDVFAATTRGAGGSNRLMINGNPTLGLQGGALLFFPPEDDLNALELSSLGPLVTGKPKHQLKAGRTLYFSKQGSPVIYSMTGAGAPAVYIPAAWLQLPDGQGHFVQAEEVDAIAVYDTSPLGGPDQDFTSGGVAPGDNDIVLFSVGRDDPAPWSPCTIYRIEWDPALGAPRLQTYIPCDRIGLREPGIILRGDNVDALDVLRGNVGAEEKPETFSIEGELHWTEECNNPAGGATVQLLNADNQVLAETTSDATTGAFSFQNLWPGEYRIMAADAGCLLIPTDVTVEGNVSDLCVPIICPGLGGCCEDDAALCYDDADPQDCGFTGRFSTNGCSTLDPPCGLGACCLADGTCLSNLTESECQSQPLHAAYHLGLTCADVQRGPVGACCRADNTCLDELSSAECGDVNGSYQGDGSACNTVACAPYGACCLSDGECIGALSESGCLSLEGTWQGDGTLCTNGSCPGAGACCLEDGRCVQLTSQGCALWNGVFGGVGSDCVEEAPPASLLVDPFSGPCLLWNVELNSTATGFDAHFENDEYQITDIYPVFDPSTRPRVRLYRPIDAPDNYEAQATLNWEQAGDASMHVALLGLRDTQGDALAQVGILDLWSATPPKTYAQFDSLPAVQGAVFGHSGSAVARLEVVECPGGGWHVSAFVDGVLLISEWTDKQAGTLEFLIERASNIEWPFDTVGLDHLTYGAFPPVLGDTDGDADCDLGDYFVFSACMSGPDISVPPGGCSSAEFARVDVDCDDDVDLKDAAVFQQAFTGP